MAKDGYDGLCKKLVGAIASKQEARRGQDYERNRRGIIKIFTGALKELRKYYKNTKVSIDFLVNLAAGAIPELSKKQIYDKIRWLVKNAEISTEDGIYGRIKWHKYGDGTVGKIYPYKVLEFLDV